MKFKALTIFLFFTILFFSGCDSKNDKKSTSSQANAQTFTLKTVDNKSINITLDGDKIILNEANGKIVLLNFFATWCPPCKAEIPNLVKLQESYKNDIVVVGILLEDFKSNEEINTFANSYGINYTVTNSKEAFDLAKALGGLKAIPANFLINKDTTLYQKIIGIALFEMLELDIKKMLEK